MKGVKERSTESLVGADISEAPRKPFVGGNWKCFGTKESVSDIVRMVNTAGTLPSTDVSCTALIERLSLPHVVFAM